MVKKVKGFANANYILRTQPKRKGRHSKKQKRKTRGQGKPC